MFQQKCLGYVSTTLVLRQYYHSTTRLEGQNIVRHRQL